MEAGSQGHELAMKAPHPPTPSPREFGRRLISKRGAKIRINEERGSQKLGWRFLPVDLIPQQHPPTFCNLQLSI